MKSIRGYRYIDAAQPAADIRHWTPLMKTLARNASNRDHASPFPRRSSHNFAAVLAPA
jgi:hypothetical protein